MRRTLLLAASLAVAFAGVALAVSFKTGTYKAGSSSGDGVTLRIGHTSFSVSRISFKEKCSNATSSFSERFTFVKGSAVKLTGTINRKGRLSGRFDSSDGTRYTCTGSHTFHAKLSK